ncbi:ABC transporter substrate-binding protein, partial [Escherichia coli]|nr:ABC transporter substrate-binding protein [Escherichia coli]
ALDAPTWQQAVPHWQAVEWDGKNGVGIKGDAAWAWLMNIQHTYLTDPCVDLGTGAPEIHGSWSLLNSVD